MCTPFNIQVTIETRTEIKGTDRDLVSIVGGRLHNTSKLSAQVRSHLLRCET